MSLFADQTKYLPRESGSAREPRHRLSPGQRELITQYLDMTFGFRCALASSDCKGPLTLDHIDGNYNNNRLENFRYLCHLHNNRERSRLARLGKTMEGVKKNENVGEELTDEPAGDSSQEMRTSMAWRPRWQAKLMEMVMADKEPVTVTVATAGLAQWIRSMTNNTKGSEVTCRRWLRETTTGPAAVFEIYDHRVLGPCVKLRLARLVEMAAPWTPAVPKVLQEKPSSS